MLIRVFGYHELNIHSAELARDLLKKATQKRHAPLVAFLRSGLRREVMIVADGEDWRETHDCLAPFFTHGRVSQVYAPIIDAVARETCEGIAHRSAFGGLAAGTIEIAAEREMRIALARVMGFVVFGRILTGAEAERLEEGLETVTRKPGPGLLMAVNKSFAFTLRRLGLAHKQRMLFSSRQKRAADAFLDWIGEVIARQKNLGAETPLVDALERRYASCDAGDRKARVVAECAMLFIAGIETTAAALTFSLAELSQDGELARRAAVEARGCEFDGASEIAQRYPLLNAIFHETLRRHTIVPTMLRDAAEPVELPAESSRGCRIIAPRGATLRYLPIQSHLRRRVWSCPLRFDPGRFAGSLSADQRNHFAPFGMGPQMCLGRSMAMIEAVMVLAAFLRRFDLAPIRFDKAIRVERNAVFTNRPIGVMVKLLPLVQQESAR